MTPDASGGAGPEGEAFVSLFQGAAGGPGREGGEDPALGLFVDLFLDEGG